jgi:hypothetical protein
MYILPVKGADAQLMKHLAPAGTPVRMVAGHAHSVAQVAVLMEAWVGKAGATTTALLPTLGVLWMNKLTAPVGQAMKYPPASTVMEGLTIQ